MALSEDLGIVPSMGGHFNKYKTVTVQNSNVSARSVQNVLCNFVDVQNMKNSKMISNKYLTSDKL